MSRGLFVGVMLIAGVALWAQQGGSSNASGQKAGESNPTASSPKSAGESDAGSSPKAGPESASSAITPPVPNQMPRSDRVNADALGDEPGQSSSKDTQIDLSPPADDEKAHPQSAEMLMDAEAGNSTGDVSEFHPWDPHKAAKNVEVGDFYFKRKNYRAAEDRYREALLYKNNDAIATFRLAVCLEKLDQQDQARKEYESYLKILLHRPQAEDAQTAIERLKGIAAIGKK